MASPPRSADVRVPTKDHIYYRDNKGIQLPACKPENTAAGVPTKEHNSPRTNQGTIDGAQTKEAVDGMTTRKRSDGRANQGGRWCWRGDQVPQLQSN